MSYKCESCKKIIAPKLSQFLRKKYSVSTNIFNAECKQILSTEKVCRTCWVKKGEEIK